MILPIHQGHRHEHHIAMVGHDVGNKKLVDGIGISQLSP